MMHNISNCVSKENHFVFIFKQDLPRLPRHVHRYNLRRLNLDFVDGNKLPHKRAYKPSSKRRRIRDRKKNFRRRNRNPKTDRNLNSQEDIVRLNSDQNYRRRLVLP